MSAGTLTLTNKSAAVTGSGTVFTTELAAGDFAVVTVGGIPYSLPVKSVNSNTSLTLVSNFTGPSQGGAAWYAVPRVAMNLVTAALVTQSAEALRGLNYDKQNWQAVFTASGTITVKLPDGSTFTGPSWKYLSDNMATKTNGSVPVSQGGTGGTTAAKALENLGAAPIKDPAFTGTVVAPEFKTSPVVNARINLESSNVNEGVLGRYVSFVNSGSAPYVVLAKGSTDQTDRVFINFPTSGGTLALTGTSDKTYKHDINDMDPLESVRNIQRMRPVTFIFNNDPDKTVRRGVIAQEIQEIDPEYVHLNLDQTDEDGITKERLSLDNNALLLDALIAIKNLADRVEELEGK